MREQTMYPPQSWITRASAARLVGVTTRTISRWKTEGHLNWGLGVRGTQPVVLYCPQDVISTADLKQPARPRIGVSRAMREAKEGT